MRGSWPVATRCLLLLGLVALSGCQRSATTSSTSSQLESLSTSSPLASTSQIEQPSSGLEIPPTLNDTVHTSFPLLTTASVNQVEVETTLTPLSGLYFGFGELWQIDSQGKQIKIYDKPIDNISPDGGWALVNNLGDYWIIDLQTHELLKLTVTPERTECCASWWPAIPGMILFNSGPTGPTPQTLGDNGHLSIIEASGLGYKVLDENHGSVYPPAPSPDGQWIAYGIGGESYLYRWNDGPHVFRPEDYGLDSLKGQTLSYPSWSPDGRYLAWNWSSMLNVGLRAGVAVFDVQNKTAQLLHVYEPDGDTFYGGPLKWSPDGSWLEFAAADKISTQSGLWLASMTGQKEQEIHLTDTTHFWGLWNPEGHFIVLTADEAPAAGSFYLIEVNTWMIRRFAIPGGMASLYGWK